MDKEPKNHFFFYNNQSQKKILGLEEVDKTWLILPKYFIWYPCNKTCEEERFLRCLNCQWNRLLSIIFQVKPEPGNICETSINMQSASPTQKNQRTKKEQIVATGSSLSFVRALASYRFFLFRWKIIFQKVMCTLFWLIENPANEKLAVVLWSAKEL